MPFTLIENIFRIFVKKNLQVDAIKISITFETYEQLIFCKHCTHIQNLDQTLIKNTILSMDKITDKMGRDKTWGMPWG